MHRPSQGWVAPCRARVRPRSTDRWPPWRSVTMNRGKMASITARRERCYAVKQMSRGAFLLAALAGGLACSSGGVTMGKVDGAAGAGGAHDGGGGARAARDAGPDTSSGGAGGAASPIAVKGTVYDKADVPIAGAN